MRQSKNSKCKVCQCMEGKLTCYMNSCETLKYPTRAHIYVGDIDEKKEINARTIPFFADIIKTMKKDSLIFIVSGLKMSNLYIGDASLSSFTLNDIIKSRVYFKFDLSKNFNEKPNEDALTKKNDQVILSFVSSSTGLIHNILIAFELKNIVKDNNVLSRSIKNSLVLNGLSKSSIENERNIRDNEEKNLIKEYYLPNPNKIPPRKTIFIQPSESIKLTSNELKPKNLGAANSNRLIYFLVSGNPKYGELKLKKIMSNDVPSSHNSAESSMNANGWNQVNEIFLEKTVKEFTQQDLDNGNVWYEPITSNSNGDRTSGETNMFSGTLSDCLNKTNEKICASIENCEKICHEFFSMSGYDFKNNARYDHCMFEVI